MFEHVLLIMHTVLAAYALGINLTAFTMYSVDKRKAVKRKHRISERALLTVAAVGGAVGAYAAMHFFRHKTKKWYFAAGVPLMIIVQVVLTVIGLALLWSGQIFSSF